MFTFILLLTPHTIKRGRNHSYFHVLDGETQVKWPAPHCRDRKWLSQDLTQEGCFHRGHYALLPEMTERLWQICAESSRELGRGYGERKECQRGKFVYSHKSLQNLQSGTEKKLWRGWLIVPGDLQHIFSSIVLKKSKFRGSNRKWVGEWEEATKVYWK
jgi:hypothetical protein